MTVGAIIEHVGGVMGRAHALFGDPIQSGEGAEESADMMAGAAGTLDGNRRAATGLSGDLASRYREFATGAASELTGFAVADRNVGAGLRDAASADRDGHAASRAAMTGAAGDATALAPFGGLPAGERSLVIALRRRVAQQRRVVEAYRLRDARLAALLRSTHYGARAAAPRAASMGFGGGGGAGPSPAPGSGIPWSPPMAAHRPIVQTVGRYAMTDPDGGHDQRAAAVPGGPAAEAVRAALSKRGVDYVWGAKGPNVFDCSGLTQWAWRQAGVQLGGDTYSQVNEGVPVPPGEVRAGDLIFPKASYDGRGPGHVQLAISATEVVHAPQTGDVVRIAPMPASFVARRPIPLS